jgi:hypothetical protein
MKIEKWTIGLAASGLISLSPAMLAQTPALGGAPQQNPMLTSLSATTISGYVDTSAVWNPGTGNANPAPYAFNAGKQDGFNLNAVDIKISKPLDETGWSAGYVAELSYGPDAAAIDGGAYPIRQAYVALHMPVGNGIDWQLGRWDNLLGYEGSDSYKDPNYTRSYGYTFEPTEHTGLLGAYKFSDAIGLQAGVVDSVTTTPRSVNDRTGAGGILGAESKKGFVSLLTLTAPDSWGSFKGSALYVGYDIGPGSPETPTIPGVGGGPATPGTPAKDRRELYVGATVNTPLKGVTFGGSWDSIEHADVGGVDTGYFSAYAAYLSYAATSKLTLNGRAEYAFGNGLGANPIGAGDVFNKVFALTGTVQYALWDNVISRLELRWDHAADSTTPFGGTAGTGPDKKNEVMVAANVIYKF